MKNNIRENLAVRPDDVRMNINEVAAYINYKKSYIYKMVHLRLIPVSKSPIGRKLCFKKSEIDEWVTANKILTIYELAKTI